MKITKDEVQQMAKQAKIKLSNEELKTMMEELHIVLYHLQSMGQGDSSRNVLIQEAEATLLRRDETKIFEDKDKLFRNTKGMKDGYLQVPKIIE